MITKPFRTIIFHLLISLCFFVIESYAVCSYSSEPLGKLVGIGKDSQNKIPLILIHGIHGTKKGETVSKPNNYWEVFIKQYWSKETELRGRFSLYVFQYCSNKKVVQDISKVLGNEIDSRIPNRKPVLLAHSMGGLIAKAYMVYYTHQSSKFRGKKGGEVILKTITLATPHHGTPGTNDPKAFESHIKFGWKTVLYSFNFLYWSSRTKKLLSLPSLNSGNPNRSDLRWDNFDNIITKNGLTNNDINIWIPNANVKFEKFKSKVILYSGVRSFSNTIDNPIIALKKIPKIAGYDEHQKLDFANDLLINGFSNRFGDTDGLVPAISSMLCSPPPYLTSFKNKNFSCISKYTLRRFEVGTRSALQKELPDKNILSITRRKIGYDHKDMYEHPDVLKLVSFDLQRVSKPNVNSDFTTKKVIPEMPTLFLMDISQSMNENNKIFQAKTAGLEAIREMRQNRRRGQDSSRVSISTFGGDCNSKNVRSLLPFTYNLNLAENVFRQKIPKPSGKTPLFTAIELSVARMSNYLNRSSKLKEGRIIVLTDGLNNCHQKIRPSGVYSQNLNQTLVYKNIKFYCIGFDIAPGSKEERDLQYLVSVSGGKYFSARNSSQLSRFFQKSTKRYFPKIPIDKNSNLYNGAQLIVKQEFENAFKVLDIYVKNKPNNAIGLYNLAVTCEALEKYKCAIISYKKYLQLSETNKELRKIQLIIREMENDYQVKLLYFLDLLRSDLEYLKGYYQRLFKEKNLELALEFKGFVSEKGRFYRNIQEILEVRSFQIRRSSEELADSLDYLKRRVGTVSFDRDAVSLLTLPISSLEDLIKHLESI